MRQLLKLSRSGHSSQLLEIFFVSAVVSVLGIRAFLAATGYPQIAGGDLHIAHMLWGGLLMGGGIVISLTYLGRTAEYATAVMGGVGFGAFIDEIGKLITVDNDYFYRPSAALIYVTFVGVFLLIRSLRSPQDFTQKEALLNALDMAKEIARKDLSDTEHRRLTYYLSLANPHDPTVIALKSAAQRVIVSPETPTRVQAWTIAITKYYRHLASKPMFNTAIITLFVAQALSSALYLLVRFAGYEKGVYILEEVPFTANIDLFSSSISLFLIVVGATMIRRSRVIAYQWFSRAVLFDILVTQVFLFYHEQFSAIVGVIVKIVLLVGLQFAINHERSQHPHK
jgi:hypothetical protein